MRSNDGDIEIFVGNDFVHSKTDELALSALGRTDQYPQIQSTFQFITQRWQLLKEGFHSDLGVPRYRSEITPEKFLTRVQPFGQNATLLIDSLKRLDHVFSHFLEDVRSLLSHVSGIEIAQNDTEMEAIVREHMLGGNAAPSISAGTARLITILAAYYALDIFSPELPGLVVIEEPDTAIHPLLLGKLVDLLRGYTERPEPRQFILTTHNPMLLNYFEPEEVRIVERDERGATTVNPVNKDVADVWKAQDGGYNLGSLWTTRLLGGVPR
jgi:predicted ATPase